MWSAAADPQSEGDHLPLDLISTLRSQLLSLRSRVQVRLRIHTMLTSVWLPRNAGESGLWIEVEGVSLSAMMLVTKHK